VLASCGNKYYGTNFIYAVPSSLLIAPGLRTIQFLFFNDLDKDVNLRFSSRESDILLVINLEGTERGVFFEVRNKTGDIQSVVQMTSVSMFVNLIVASRSLLLIAKGFDINQILFIEKFTKRLLDWERERDNKHSAS
jgi:hypothetical protein